MKYYLSRLLIFLVIALILLRFHSPNPRPIPADKVRYPLNLRNGLRKPGQGILHWQPQDSIWPVDSSCVCGFVCLFLDFFWCGPFLKSLLNLLQYCFCFMFWIFGPEACGILAPRPGIKPTPSALEGEVLTTGLPGKSLQLYLVFTTNIV